MRPRPQLDRGLTLFFLACLFLSTVWPIERGQWLPTLAPLSWVVMGAILVSYWLSRRRLPGALLHAVASVLGVALVLGLTAWAINVSGFPARMAALVQEVRGWIEALGGEESQTGVVPFAASLLALTWLSGYLSAWYLFRGHGPWVALASSGLTLLVTLASLPPSFLWHLVPYFLAACLLVAQTRWTSHGQRQGPGGLWLAGWVLALGGLALLVAWPLPLAGKAPLRGPFDRFQDVAATVELQMERLFNAIPNRRAEAADYFPLLGLQNDLSLKEGQPLGARVLFTVSSPRATYWRTRSFDIYTSWGWASSPTQIEDFPEAAPELWEGREQMAYEVKLAVPADIFVIAGEAVSLSLPAQAHVLYPGPPGRSAANVPEVIALQSPRMLTSAGRYTVVSSVPRAAPEALRGVGADYPSWITARYLQLTPYTPERLTRLAQEITAAQPTPYDKALALQKWLNTAFRYSLNIPAPPYGVDAVDYFLFESKEGFCDYYGSAMAVMLRAVGIPARVATGFAPGDWDAQRREHIIREWHAHTWTEVFFPSYGWVPFEPTPPEAARQPRRDVTYGPGPGAEGVAGGEEEFPGGPIPEIGIRAEGSFSGLSYLGIGALGLLAFYGLRRFRRWWTLGEVTPALKTYSQVCRLATLAALGPRSQETPQEYAARLAQAMPSHGQQVVRLSQLYIQVRYAKEKGIGAGQYLELEEIYRRLRWPLLWRALRLPS